MTRSSGLYTNFPFVVTIRLAFSTEFIEVSWLKVLDFLVEWVHPEPVEGSNHTNGI